MITILQCPTDADTPINEHLLFYSIGSWFRPHISDVNRICYYHIKDIEVFRCWHQHYLRFQLYYFHRELITVTLSCLKHLGFLLVSARFHRVPRKIKKTSGQKPFLVFHLYWWISKVLWIWISIDFSIGTPPHLSNCLTYFSFEQISMNVPVDRVRMVEVVLTGWINTLAPVCQDTMGCSARQVSHKIIVKNEIRKPVVYEQLNLIPEAVWNQDFASMTLRTIIAFST